MLQNTLFPPVKSPSTEIYRSYKYSHYYANQLYHNEFIILIHIFPCLQDILKGFFTSVSSSLIIL